MELDNYHNSPGKGWTWYSFCSAPFDINCERCMAGHWVNDEERAKDSELYKKDYPAWFLKMNGFPLKNEDIILFRENINNFHKIKGLPRSRY